MNKDVYIFHWKEIVGQVLYIYWLRGAAAVHNEDIDRKDTYALMKIKCGKSLLIKTFAITDRAGAIEIFQNYRDNLSNVQFFTNGCFCVRRFPLT